MHIAVEVGGFSLRETGEGFVSSQLMLSCHFESSYWCNLTVVLDSTYNKPDSVLFSEVLWWDLDLVIVSLVIGVLSFLSRLGLLLDWGLLVLFTLLFLDKKSVGLSCEE